MKYLRKLKKNFLFFAITLSVQQNIAQCNSGSYTVTTNTVISGSCIINGDLTISNGASFDVDFTNAATDTLVVRGNILLQGNAVLWVHAASGSTGGQFIVSNSYSGQRSITTKDSSRVQLEYIELRTQEGDLANAASIYMNYDAEDNSKLYINKSWLNTQTAWLLCNMKNRSTLIGNEPNHVPTEIYIQDTAQVALHGRGTNVGLWLNFESITGTLNLPPDQAQPYSWKIGRNIGGINTPWYLEVDTASPGLAVQIFPSSKITINGSGLPATGELKVALMFSNSTDTVKGLKVGLQNTTVADGPNGNVALNNVNLGPIAWQLYALINENLSVKNSIVNEIGISGPSNVTVDSSLLQLAVLGALGIGGSAMTINNSEIWNQSITAANNSTITLNDCKVYGSAFSTSDALSRIIVNGGCFFQNPTGCTGNNMINLATGQPYCNPFISPGFPKNLSPATVAFNGVNNNCMTDINDSSLKIFPNPSNHLININIPSTGQAYSIEIYTIVGQRIIETQNQKIIDLSNLSEGVYIIRVRLQGKTWVNKIVKI
jgi:hypothetical protein